MIEKRGSAEQETSAGSAPPGGGKDLRVRTIVPGPWLRACLAAAALVTPFALLVSLEMNTVGGYNLPTHHALVYAGITAAVLAFLLTPWSRRRLKLLIASALAASLFGIDVLTSLLSLPGHPVASWACIVVPLGIALTLARANLAMSGAYLMFTSLLALPIPRILFTLEVYQGGTEEELARVLRDPLVTPLAITSRAATPAGADASLLVPLSDPGAITFSADGTLFATFTGNTGGDQGLFVLRPDGSRHIVPGPARSAAYDPLRNRIYVVDGGHRRIGVVEVASLSVSHWREIPGTKTADWAVYDSEHDRVYLTTEEGEFLAFEPDSLEIVHRARLSAYCPRDARLFPKHGILVVRGLDGFVDCVDTRTLEVVSRCLGLFWAGLGLGQSIDRDELYVPSMLFGGVEVLDAGTLRRKVVLHGGRGLRHVVEIPDSPLLAGSGFVDGILYILDRDSDSVRARVFLGRGFRALSYEAATDSILGGTDLGLFRVPVAVWRHPTPTVSRSAAS